ARKYNANPYRTNQNSFLVLLIFPALGKASKLSLLSLLKNYNFCRHLVDFHSVTMPALLLRSLSVHCPFRNGEIAEVERPWYDLASELLPELIVSH
ncbi:MAG: hypothetical protein MJZ56_07495, partial [Bacteroidales bacterium]|nr:hypothetical protein [Bacteroidales bacterium]